MDREEEKPSSMVLQYIYSTDFHCTESFFLLLVGSYSPVSFLINGITHLWGIVPHQPISFPLPELPPFRMMRQCYLSSSSKDLPEAGSLPTFPGQ